MGHNVRSHRKVRLVRGLAAVAAAALLAAACSSDDDKGSSTTTAGSTAATTATTTAASTGATGDTTAATTAETPAPTTPATSGGGSSDEALVIARGMDVNSLDPSLAYCDTCQIFMTAVYETLIGLDPNDNTKFVPRLASEWDSNADQTEFTFTLDPNAAWPDGSPVTSADVKFSWERLAGLQGSSSYLVSSVEAIDDSDPAVVKVTLNAPNSAFLAQVNAPYLGIMQKSEAEANGATTDPDTDEAEPWFLTASAGSGPYALASYEAGNELRFSRNDSYWGTPANFPEVIIKETADAVTQRQQLEQGAVDIAMQLSADVADGIGGDVTVERVPSYNFVYVALSPGAKGGEALTPEVREAIRLSLDYTGLIDVTVGGAGQPQPSPIPNGFAGTEGLPTPAQDLDTAKQLLADAGVTSLTLDATYPSLNVYGVDFTTAMQKVQTDLKEVGIELELNPVEIAVWADIISSDGIPVTMVYFAPDHTDSSQYVQYFGLIEDSSWQARSGSDIDPNQQQLLADAFATQDPAERADLYNQIATAMIADNIIIPVVNPDLFLASRADITGMHYSACCNLDLARLGRS